MLSGKYLYKQMIVVSSDNTFPASFPNIFIDYPSGEMRIGNKSLTNWNKTPFRLWQTFTLQLEYNFI